jgi:hypothetical protein
MGCTAGSACTTSAGAAGICAAAGTCNACIDGTDDGACATAYGTGYLCGGGACVKGNCHSSTDCKGSSQLCGATTAYTCGACTSDTQCQSDVTYGATFACNTAMGQCITNSCTASTTKSTCSFNSADICCATGSTGTAGTCVAAPASGTSCCTAADCGGGVGMTCAGHVCTACALPTGGDYYVDPAAGSDTGGTGSMSAGCAFATITRALQFIGTPSAAVRIHVLGDPRTSGTAPIETLPITIPTNVTIDGGAHTMNVPAGATGFRMNAPGATLQNIAIVGPGATGGGGRGGGAFGISAVTGSSATAAAPTTISGVNVSAFPGVGIDVSGGGLVIKDNVVSTGNGGAGLHVGNGFGGGGGGFGAGFVKIMPTAAAASVTATPGPSVQFVKNAGQGINVDGTGSIEIDGSTDASSPATPKTNVLVGFNTLAGLRIAQENGGGGMVPANTVTGLLAWQNGTLTAPIYGFHFGFGSTVKVRSSATLGNTASGVQIESTAAFGRMPSTSIAGFDFGTAKDGGNTFQTATTGAAPNGGAGICINVPTATTGLTKQTLAAQGNLFAGSPVTDCRTATATLVSTAAPTYGCKAGTDVDFANATTAGFFAFDVSGCMP